MHRIYSSVQCVSDWVSKIHSEGWKNSPSASCTLSLQLSIKFSTEKVTCVLCHKEQGVEEREVRLRAAASAHCRRLETHIHSVVHTLSSFSMRWWCLGRSRAGVGCPPRPSLSSTSEPHTRRPRPPANHQQCCYTPYICIQHTLCSHKAL